MPDTLISVDLSRPATENEMLHNRWHPDIPVSYTHLTLPTILLV